MKESTDRKKHIEKMLYSKQGNINISGLNTGCYFVELRTNLNVITRKKLMITK